MALRTHDGDSGDSLSHTVPIYERHHTILRVAGRDLTEYLMKHLTDHTFVPMSRTCKKQTAVSHSSTEAQRISVDAGLRLAGGPALDLWDTVTDVFEASSCERSRAQQQTQEDETTLGGQEDNRQH